MSDSTKKLPTSAEILAGARRVEELHFRYETLEDVKWKLVNHVDNTKVYKTQSICDSSPGNVFKCTTEIDIPYKLCYAAMYPSDDWSRRINWQTDLSAFETVEWLEMGEATPSKSLCQVVRFETKPIFRGLISARELVITVLTSVQSDTIYVTGSSEEHRKHPINRNGLVRAHNDFYGVAFHRGKNNPEVTDLVVYAQGRPNGRVPHRVSDMAIPPQLLDYYQVMFKNYIKGVKEMSDYAEYILEAIPERVKDLVNF